MATYQNGYNNTAKNNKAKVVTAGTNTGSTYSPNYHIPEFKSQYQNALPSAEKLNTQSQQFANDKYEDTRLGLQQQGQRYQQLINQQRSTQDIYNEGNRRANNMYADALLQVDAGTRDAQLNHRFSLMDANDALEQASNAYRGGASDNRRAARADALRRGLVDSDYLNVKEGQIGEQLNRDMTTLGVQHQKNIGKLDLQLNTLLANLNDQRTSLTARKQQEAQATIDELIRQRDNEKASYELAINQIYEQNTRALERRQTDALQYYNQQLPIFAGLENQYNQQAYERALNERNFAYQSEQDRLNREYQIGRDTVSDGQWQAQFDQEYGKQNQFDQNYANTIAGYAMSKGFSEGDYYNKNPETMRNNLLDYGRQQVFDDKWTQEQYKLYENALNKELQPKITKMNNTGFSWNSIWDVLAGPLARDEYGRTQTQAAIQQSRANNPR